MRPQDLVQRLGQSLELDAELAQGMARRIMPTLVLEDLSRPWTNDAYQVRWAAGQKAAAAGGAGKYSMVQLSNGYNVGSYTDTGVLVVVTRVQVQGDVDLTAGFVIALNANECTSIGTDIDFLDMRLRKRGWNPAASIRSGNAAVALNSPECWQVKYEHDRRPLVVEFPAIIPSGMGLMIQAREANVALYGAFQWFEVDAPLLAK